MRKIIDDKKDVNSKKNIIKTRNTEKKHRRKKSSRVNYKVKLGLTYGLLFCVICSVCFFLSSTVLFKINSIEVQGDEVCDADILIEKSGIKVGDNLFFAKSNAVAAKLEKEVPDIDKVFIKKKIPNKVIIDVKKADRVFDVQCDDFYIAVSENGKVLNVSDEYDENTILLQGVNPVSFEVGSKIVYKDKSINDKIMEIIDLMNAKNLSPIREINFCDEFNIIVNYDNRIKINFGIYENMDYKVRNASEILHNKIGAGETGTLDLSAVSKENRSYFTPSY